MNILGARVLVFDVETTGTSPTADGIVEFAAVELVHGRIGNVFSWRIDPMMPIPPEASEVHGITDADVAGCPFFADVADQIAALLRGADAVAGYNAVRFDAPFINEAFACVPHDFRLDPTRVLDPFIFLRRRHAHLPGTLAQVCDRFGVRLDNAHAAASDARATADLLVAFMGAGGAGVMPSDLDHAWMVQDRWRGVIEDEDAAFGRRLYRDYMGDGEEVIRIGFSRHRGRRLDEVDTGFLRWAVDLDGLHPGALDALQSELTRRRNADI